MNRVLLAIFLPPIAVCRYGCAGCCAAPIGVFWVTGIIGILYGIYGGPLNLEHVSWPVLGLGVGLWLIASVWAIVTIFNVCNELENRTQNPLCKSMQSTDEVDESPLDQVNKTDHASGF